MGEANLATRVRDSRRALDLDRGRARSLAQRGIAVQAQVEDLTATAETLDRVARLLTRFGEERASAAQAQVEELVTRGLQVVFGEELSFHLVSKVSGRQVVTEMIVRTTLADGTQVDTPVLDARGGGLSAVVGFLLRVVVLLLSGAREPLLVLDETFAHLSSDYLDRAAEFLRELVDSTGIQVLMVTHQSAFTQVADVVHRFSVTDGRTRVVTSR